MDVTKLIERLPTEVKNEIIDFCDVGTIKGPAMRVTLDSVLDNDQVEKLKKVRGVLYVGVCHYRHAPEIRKTYFYIK